jgi:hypothetical protein
MELENSVNINIQKDLNVYFFKNDYKHIKITAHQNRITRDEDFLEKACFLYKDNIIVINYSYLKWIMKNGSCSNESLIEYIMNVFKETMRYHKNFILHMNSNHLTMLDIDKYYLFIKNISLVMKESFPNNLDKCFVYNAPFIFSKLFSILSVFIDKATLQKIKIVHLD